MTATKTKPDGWVVKEWWDKREDYRDSWEIVLFDHEPEYHPETTMPVCLVPPALIDAIDEVIRGIEEGWIRIAPQAEQDLLNKLKEIMK